MSKYARRMIFNAIMAVLAVALIVAVVVLSADTALSEKATRTVTHALTSSLGRLSSSLPFSLFETLAFIAAAVALFLIVKGVVFLCKRQFLRGFCSFTTLVATVVCVISVYMLDTTFAYNREKPPLNMYSQQDYDKESMLAAADGFMTEFLELANTIERDEEGYPVCTMTVEELSDVITEEYKKLNDDYYCDYIPRAKGMAFSPVMSSAMLAGITFTPLGEANVNKEERISSKIFTIAHEMAHATGIMREEDANLVAAYVLINSENDLLKYSAMYTYYDRITDIAYVYDEEKYTEYTEAVKNSPVSSEIAKTYAFWMEKAGVFSKISSFFNDIYLKFNGQNLGTDSYDDDMFWDVIPSDPDEDGNITYDVQLSDIQLALLSPYYVG